MSASTETQHAIETIRSAWARGGDALDEALISALRSGALDRPSNARRALLDDARKGAEGAAVEFDGPLVPGRIIKVVPVHSVQDAICVLCALAPAAEVQASQWWRLNRERLTAILTARDRRFRDAFANACFSQPAEHGRWIAWDLINDGLAALPDCEGTVWDLIVSDAPLGPIPDPSSPDPAVMGEAKARLDLLEPYLWRIFEVDHPAGVSLAQREKYRLSTMSDRLLALEQTGLLDRQRLLDASLGALTRGFPSFRAGWFSAFHERLNPSDAERVARVDRYLQLLASPVRATVRTGLDALLKIQKQGALDPEQLIDALPPAMLAPAKAHVRKALTLAKRAASANPAFASAAAHAIVRGLEHPEREVQLLVAKELETLSAAPTEALRARVVSSAQAVHPLVHAALAAWLDETVASPTPAPTGITTVASPLPLRTLAEARWLPAEQELTPLRTADDVLERVVTVLEDPQPGDDLELMLAAMAAMPTGQHGPTKPWRTVLRRAERIVAAPHDETLGIRRDIAAVVCAWAGVPVPPPARQFLTGARLNELIDVSRRGEPVILLASPTHAGGRLSPLALVERLISDPQAAKRQPADFAAALLRLVPDDDALNEALSRATRARGVPRTAIRWMQALPEFVAHDFARRGVIPHAAEPSPKDVLTIDGEPDCAPDGSSAWRYRLTFRHDWIHGQPAEPTLTATRRGMRWSASHTPAALGAWSQCAAAQVIPNRGGHWEAPYGREVALDPLFDRTLPLPIAAHLALALWLTDSRPELSTRAIDLLIEASEDRRVDTQRLGEWLGALSTWEMITPARAAIALRTAATAGPVVATGVRATLREALLHAEPPRRHELLGFLELLEELLLHTGDRVDEELASRLRSWPGTGKAAAAAERLLHVGRP